MGVFSSFNESDVIKRKDWWANEYYRYRDSTQWKWILNKWDLSSKRELTEYQKKIKEDRNLKLKSINNYLINIYPENNILVQTIKNENGHSLAWNIQKTKYVKAIVIHHTESEYDNSKVWINAIYKFHSLNRAWWDIWYNYIIGYNWEVYEWRAGWYYTIWAHAVYNNRSTVSISVMWNYNEKSISSKQYKSLDNLVKFLTKKYWIDLSEKYTYHRECFWDNCKIWVNSYEDYSLVWHRDAWITNCPWDELHKQIQDIRKNNISFTSGFSFISNENSVKIDRALISWKKIIKKLETSINKLSERNKLLLLAKVEEKLDKLNFDNEKYYLYYQIKDIILKDFKKWEDDKKIYEHLSRNEKSINKSFDKTNKITVKLSYPLNDFINISAWENNFEIKRIWSNLLLNWKIKKIISVRALSNPYLEITSWDRIPSWDKKKIYNDNKFRWDIILYVKNWKLNVVNRLYLSDYLKWLWEVSDTENLEKIKTIIISARTYARWYMTKDKKFPNEFYEASDNPDVFQKYLWYGLEERSPNVNKIVDETIDTIITYKWNIIKPWYFSSSDWNTRNFKKFCETANGIPDCEKSSNFPFLSWVRDPWGIWKKRWWHWIGIAWTWVKYFSERSWNSEMIIKYFLKGVEIIRL